MLSNVHSVRRFAIRVLMVGSLIVTSGAEAEERSWWPSFGGNDSEPAAEAETTAQEDPMVDSPLFQVGWPKIQMPKLAWKPSWGKNDATPAAPSENPISGALDKVAAASKRTADGVRNAWGSAVSKLTPSSGAPTGQVAKSEEGGFWSRLLKPQAEPQGPQTTTEFLAQERPGLTR